MNETNIGGTYQIDFAYDPENPASFKAAMDKLGLAYKKEERVIEVLVISQVKQ